jgi:hypothetical protein
MKIEVGKRKMLRVNEINEKRKCLYEICVSIMKICKLPMMILNISVPNVINREINKLDETQLNEIFAYLKKKVN